MKTAWLFDIDGVLTNPELKKVIYPEIFTELIKRLKKGDLVALNSGRSTDFIVAEILRPLEKIIPDNILLENVFALGEKGAVLITYNKKGSRIINIDKIFSTPKSLQKIIRDLVIKPPYSDVMFYDETKKTMITVEIKTRVDAIEFEKRQQSLVNDLQKILTKMNILGNFKIEVFRMATDIQNHFLGKAFGTKKFVDLLASKQIFPDEYICFGDDTLDYEMFEELKRMGEKSKFVFVGEKERLKDKDIESVIFTKEPLDKGTLEYLQRK